MLGTLTNQLMKQQGGSSQDWNLKLQIVREICKGTQADECLSDKTIFQLHQYTH
jgi:hypothetical protein